MLRASRAGLGTGEEEEGAWNGRPGLWPGWRWMLADAWVSACPWSGASHAAPDRGVGRDHGP